MKLANNADMRGARLLNATGLTDASGNLTGAVAYAMASTYDAMLALGTPAVMTIVQVATDSDKSSTNTEYNVWPNSVRTYMGISDQMVDYTAVGTTIWDGAGPWANDQNQSYLKAFDNSINTYFRSSTQNPWVGRNLASAKKVSRIILTPAQDMLNAGNLNGAQVQYSNDGSTWTNIGSAVSGVGMGNYTTPVVINFTAITAQYFRVQLTNYGWLAEMRLLLIRQ